MTDKKDKNIPPRKGHENDDAIVQPDPETLDTTDPQENMEGPISSLVQKAKETIEENDEEADAEEDKK